VKFIIQIIKGVIRDQPMRRMVMFVVVVVAVVLLFAGMTFLSGQLGGNPFWFLLYWAACAWLTHAALLLALYDLLALRRRAARERAERKRRIFSKDDKKPQD
jgi:hypothetical protein